MINNDIQKILIVQTAFAGDVILTTPLIYEVKKFFSHAEIHFLGIPSTVNLIENNPAVSKIITFDKRGQHKGFLKAIQFGKAMKSEHYDVALIPHRSIRSAFIVWLAGIPNRIGFNTSSGSFLFTKTINYERKLHEIERNISLLRVFKNGLSYSKPVIYPDEADKQRVFALFSEWEILNTDKLIGIAPGSIWPTKCWPEQNFIQLVDRLIDSTSAYKIVLIGGKLDQELCERIKNDHSKRVINTAGQLTLRQSAELIGKCMLLLSNDSAPMHMGVATDTKVISIFGPTIPGFGFYPYDDKHIILEKKGLYCRPCSIHGGKKCPEKHFRCMKEIYVDDVYQTILNYESH